jgi:hypothetical protein
VEGVLWYFPFENDQESVPLDPHTMGRMLLMSNRGPDGAHTQHNAAVGTLQALTQQRGGGAAGTQMPGWQSQRPAPGGQDPARASAEPDAAEVEAAGQAVLGCRAVVPQLPQAPRTQPVCPVRLWRVQA